MSTAFRDRSGYSPSIQMLHHNEMHGPRFPRLLRAVKRWQLAGGEARPDETHFSLQTGLISKLAFNIDVSNSTGCCDDRLDGIFNRSFRKELLGGSCMNSTGLPRMHTDNKTHFLLYSSLWYGKICRGNMATNKLFLQIRQRVYNTLAQSLWLFKYPRIFP